MRLPTRNVITSSGVTCNLPPNPPPTSGATTRTSCSGVPVTRASISRTRWGTWVDDHKRPLLSRTRAHERTWLDRCRDQPLLTEPAADHHLGLLERLGDVAAVAGRARVVDPVVRPVRPLVGMYERRAVSERGLHVQHRRQRLVLDLDRLEGVRRRVRAAGDDHGDRLPHVVHRRHGERRVIRLHHVVGDRPRARQAALLVGEVRAREGGHHARAAHRTRHVDRGDLRVCHRAPQDREMEHPGQHKVVGPRGLPGDQPAILLAQAGAAELRRGGGAVVDGGHAGTGLPAAAITASSGSRSWPVPRRFPYALSPRHHWPRPRSP